MMTIDRPAHGKLQVGGAIAADSVPGDAEALRSAGSNRTAWREPVLAWSVTFVQSMILTVRLVAGGMASLGAEAINLCDCGQLLRYLGARRSRGHGTDAVAYW
jgi:hypothetical protein